MPSRLEVDDNEEGIKIDPVVAQANEDYNNAVEKAKKEYKCMVTGKSGLLNDADRVTLLHELAWLEHRRWNAFTRVKGFKQTKEYDVYAVPGEIGSYKQMDIKLHPCLVEYDKKGIRVCSDSSGKIGLGQIFLCSDDAEPDLLDELSYDLYRKKYNDYNFKLYDYPMIEKTILDSINLPSEYMNAARITARNLHTKWYEEHMIEGWKFGSKHDEVKKKQILVWLLLMNCQRMSCQM